MKLFREIAKELLVVILGILVALAINNYVQDRKNKQFLKESITLIQTEQAVNAQKLQKSIARQKESIQIYQQHIDADSLSIAELIARSKGFTTINLSQSAWSKLLSKHVELVDYKLFKSLTKIENQLAFIDDIKLRLGDVGFDRALKTDKASKQLVLTLMQDLVRAEEELAEEYAYFNEITQ